MATNEFKPFATGSGANVTNQAEWEASQALITGFQSGKASSAQVNKAIRQASFIAAAVAQFIANQSGNDVHDDGNMAALVTSILSAINKTSQPLDQTLTALAALATGANKLPYFTGPDTASQTDITQVGRDIIGQATKASVLAYLGIPDAAYALLRTNNLSDLNNKNAAVTNLGLDDTVQKAGVALDRTKNLSDLNSIPAAKITLGILPVGTTNNTVAAGDDSRITGAAQKSANLADLGDKAAARNNLGLKDGAVTDIATQGEVAAGTVGKLITAATLSGFFDLGSTAVNGSIRIPNRPGGILIAWGTAAAGSDGTFTAAFNNPPFVIPQVASGQGSGAFAPDHVVVQSVTNTGFSTYNQSLARKYIAIGK